LTTNKSLAAILTLLEDADTVRVVCPYCGGGASAEKSFNATREGESFFWKCFRASCGVSGSTGPNRSITRVRVGSTKRNTSTWEGECEQLSDEWRQFLKAKVGFTDWHLTVCGALYAPKEHRVAFPIFGPMGERRGWVLRSYDPEAYVKALTKPERDDEPCTSHYRTRVGEGHVVVVEDIPSAVRAARYSNAVALNGTGCRVDDAMELAAHYRHVTWALDKDAVRLSLKWHMKYGGLFNQSEILVLPKDLKDMQEDELEALMNE
jgi:hypothetical protein